MGVSGLDTAPGMGHRVGIYDLEGNLVCRFGEEEEGEGEGQFIIPTELPLIQMVLYMCQKFRILSGVFTWIPRDISGVFPNTVKYSEAPILITISIIFDVCIGPVVQN